jgi:hypothetical protein
MQGAANDWIEQCPSNAGIIETAIARLETAHSDRLSLCAVDYEFANRGSESL